MFQQYCPFGGQYLSNLQFLHPCFFEYQVPLHIGPKLFLLPPKYDFIVLILQDLYHQDLRKSHQNTQFSFLHFEFFSHVYFFH